MAASYTVSGAEPLGHFLNIGIRRIAKQQHPTQTASSQATRHSSTLNSLRRSLIIASGPFGLRILLLPPLDGFRNGRADVPIHRISAAQLRTRVLSGIASRRIAFIALPAQRSSNLDSQTFRSPLKSSLDLIFPRVRSRHRYLFSPTWILHYAQTVPLETV